MSWEQIALELFCLAMLLTIVWYAVKLFIIFPIVLIKEARDERKERRAAPLLPSTPDQEKLDRWNTLCEEESTSGGTR